MIENASEIQKRSMLQIQKEQRRRISPKSVGRRNISLVFNGAGVWRGHLHKHIHLKGPIAF